MPILYEGRTAEGAVSDGRDLDQLFEDMFQERTPDEIEAIKRKYATKASIFEAPQLIEAKAADMLRHYVEHILPNGLKAQVVAYSRRAAIEYERAFREARDLLVKDAGALDEETRQLDDLELEGKPAKVRAAVRAWRTLDLVKKLEFAPVISPGHNDPGEWSPWSDGGKAEARIERFKQPLLHDDPTKTDPLAFLIVKSMLLTGFDAPIEGVMYLDRSIREAELLQAIARVNRTGHGKSAGLVVDYFGVARHLKEALSAYSDEDIQGALQSLDDEIPKLRDRHQRVLAIFQAADVDIHDSMDDCVHLLRDEKLRAQFKVKLKQFLATLDLVLPRPEALPYVNDAKRLGEIHIRAQRMYRDGAVTLGKEVGRKVQHLIDEHVISLGIDPKIPPIQITDATFDEHVGRQISDRAKASEMEHAARHHIRKKLDEDPVHYQKLSERLDEIIAKHGEDWEQLYLELRKFVPEVVGGRKQDDGLGLDPELEAPFFDLLKEEREKTSPVTAMSDKKWLAAKTRELVANIRQTVRAPGFWKNAVRQEELRGVIFMFLSDDDIVDFDGADAAADRLVELAKANHHKLEKDG